MYAKPAVTDNIKTRHTTFLLDFSFKNNITMLMGDSGMGKTLIFGILQELSATDSRIKCINYINAKRELEEEIKKSLGKLFVIDNADAILDEEIRKYISVDSNNQYFIIGRNPKNLMITRENLYELDRIKEGNITKYYLKEYL